MTNKIYAVTLYAEKRLPGWTRTAYLTQVFRGDDFDQVYRRAEDDCKEMWPLDEGWCAHKVTFCQVPYDWIREAVQ